jgi:ParB family chromosome partitioning protein
MAPTVLEPHPIALCWPDLSESDFLALKEDIDKNGQRNPVILYQEKVLDGVQRTRVCLLLGREPITASPEISDPVAYAISQNLHRRHLSSIEKAVVADRLAKLQLGTNRYVRKVDPSDEGPTLTVQEAAELVGASDSQIWRLRQVRRDGIPELVEAMESGEVNAAVAAEISHAKPEAQPVLLAEAKNHTRPTKSRKSKAPKAEKRTMDPRDTELLAQINAPSIFPAHLPLPVHPTKPHSTRIIQKAISLLQNNEALIAGLPSMKQLNDKIWINTQCIQTYATEIPHRVTGPIDRLWVKWAESVADKYRRREEMLDRAYRRKARNADQRDVVRYKEPRSKKGYEGRLHKLRRSYGSLLRKAGFSLADEDQLLVDIQELTKTYFNKFRGSHDRNGQSAHLAKIGA